MIIVLRTEILGFLDDCMSFMVEIPNVKVERRSARMSFLQCHNNDQVRRWDERDKI